MTTFEYLIMKENRPKRKSKIFRDVKHESENKQEGVGEVNVEIKNTPNPLIEIDDGTIKPISDQDAKAKENAGFIDIEIGEKNKIRNN